MDECGNETAMTQTIQVLDTTAPELEVADDLTVECDEPVPGPEWVAEDNCGDPMVTVSEEELPGDCPNEYVIIRTYLAMDECGNETAMTQTINVIDTTAPDLEVADDLTVECDEPVPGPAWEANDNCGDVEVTVSEETIPGQCPQEYVIIRTYLAMDECGNESAMTQTINVVDTTAPELEVAPSLTLECDEPVPGPEWTLRIIVATLWLR